MRKLYRSNSTELADMPRCYNTFQLLKKSQEAFKLGSEVVVFGILIIFCLISNLIIFTT